MQLESKRLRLSSLRLEVWLDQNLHDLAPTLPRKINYSEAKRNRGSLSDS